MSTYTAPFDLDRDFYIVLDRDGYIRETPRKLLDLAGAVRMVEELDWDIASVLTLSPIAHTSRDATFEIAEAISARLFDENVEPHPLCARFLDRMAMEYPTPESVAGRQRAALLIAAE